MRFALFDYQLKGEGLARLAQRAGHTRVDRMPFDVLLIDTDFPWAHDRIAVIEQAHDFGAAVAVYPHGGEPLFFYDGICDPHPDVDAFLVTAAGHRQFQQRFGHKRIIEVGWYWCPQKPLDRRRPRNVLFAPIHPWVDGVTIAPAFRDANRDAYDAVCGLDLKVTVRYQGDLEPNGIEPRPGVTLVAAADRDLNTAAIDQHDLVVSAGTFASLALARGKPVVMTDQHLVPHNDHYTQPAATFEQYREEVRYPLSVGDAPLPELVERACDGDGEEWRERFVGPPATVATVAAAFDQLEATLN